MRSRLIKAHQPCPSCNSSDALSIYDDHTYCFSCNKYTAATGSSYHKSQTAHLAAQAASYHHCPPSSSFHMDNCTYQYVSLRGITEDVMRFFGCQTKVSPDGEPLAIGFPYSNDGETYKVRDLTTKSFHSVGDMKNATLFGMSKFSPASSRAITITEGEFDALAVYQMLGSGYPVVSVRSASSAGKDCSAARDFLNSFDKIYLCLDADEPGQKAAQDIARLFDFNKVYHVRLDPKYKDANGYLLDNQSEAFKRTWWNSKRFVPEGVLSTFSEFDDIIDNSTNKQGVPYPFPTLTELTYGIRTGETVLFTAMEGIGKTEIIRAIEYYLFRNTTDNIGIIHLEEGKERALKGLAGYELKTPVHLPTSLASNNDIKAALHTVVGRDDRLHLYSHFGSSDPNVILDTIRFLVSSCGCKYIFLDHITMVVSGLAEDDERKALDFISTRLAMMVEELDFALIFVSHINDEGKTRGSRNISKIAGTWIELSRDQQAPSEEERNTTYLTIRKNRFGARTGPAGKLYFDLSTFIVSETSSNLPPVHA